MSEIVSSEMKIAEEPIDVGFYYKAVSTTLLTLSASSKRIYWQTYNLWEQWCGANSVNPLDIRPSNVHSFLISKPVTKITRQRYLSAIRKLARMLALDDRHPQFRRTYEMLLLVKTPTEDVAGSERIRKVLNNQEVWQVLSAWQMKELIAIRNTCMLALMFYTGLRRAELAALQWNEIDLVTGTIHVRHGKGDKSRDIAIVEDSQNTAVNALKNWKEVLWKVAASERKYIFCPIAKGGKLGDDKPISVLAINQIIKKTSQLAGIEFTPHAARRTLATDLLSNGSSTADVQAQLGHAHASTTIQGYALPADARKRRARFKTSY